MTDWHNIRTEYETGASQRSLAKKYGIAQPTISERAKKEQWQRSPIIPLSEPITYSETDEFTIVQKAINHLATFLQNDQVMDLKDHKLFADALSQYMKIKLLTPAGEDFSAFDMREFLAGCTDEELEIVRPIIAAVQARRSEKITPIKKVG